MRRSAPPFTAIIPLTLLALTATSCNVEDMNATGLEPQQRRVAIQSQCAQNAIECTTSWPTPVVDVVAGLGQTVIPVSDGFIVEQAGESDSAFVQLMGSNSVAGDGATQILYSWSAGATDDDVCSLDPGTEFSTEADPLIELQYGFHYIRLTVRNNILRDEVPVEGCETLEGVQSFDFVEVEIEVR